MEQHYNIVSYSISKKRLDQFLNATNANPSYKNQIEAWYSSSTTAKKEIEGNEYFSAQVMMLVFPYLQLFNEFMRRYYKEELETFENLRDVADISMPDEWFPAARQMKRKIYYHMGPTNSGKTKAAIEALLSAK